MYDQFAENCLRQLPEFDGTNWEECRRRLSRLYFAIIQLRLNENQLAGSEEAIDTACDYLRRLANGIEQYLFDEPARNEDELKRSRAHAFIAAEAIDLWCGFQRLARQGAADTIEVAYARIESALLYLSSDYQVNAHCSVAGVNHLFLDIYDREERDKDVISYLQGILICLATGKLRTVPASPAINYSEFDAITAARVSVIKRISSIVLEYIEWLSGQRGSHSTEDSLFRLLENLKPTSNLVSSVYFADLQHLCTLLVNVVNTSKHLSVFQNLPRLELNELSERNYERYLRYRTINRPFLWPSAKEYVENTFPGPHSDAVVVVPTGSGKSFLAELACSQAMQSGWVLYLAPTNALVNQVQRDLTLAFKPLGDVQVLSFIGGQEYTNLTGELLEAPPNLSVAVMTPEKCAVAIRINPNVFQNCKLCIVDEFHLIDDANRGITLDLCLAQIVTINSNTRLLLMSAMVSNGDEIREWLRRLRNGENVPLVEIPWRPCRTLRSLLMVQRDESQRAFEAARTQLGRLPANRRNVKFNAPLGLLGGMLLQWREGGIPEDYVSVPVPLMFEAKAKRGRRNADYDGWKNTVGTQLAGLFSRCGSTVLCFILTSRHHVFSCAEKVDSRHQITLEPHSTALIDLANVELGVPSKVGELLRSGIGVHSSAMLDAEQAAVERSFANRSIGLLFATPTLAQGLNLPADVVIVAGSSLGGGQQAEEDRMQGVRDSDATILNAFGRAGRATVANHGLAVLVSDSPFFGPLSESVGVNAVVRSYNLLGGSDKCVNISSPIESFIERLTPETPLDALSSEELGLVAQLSNVRETNAEVLSNTLGAFLAERRQTEVTIEAAAGRVRDIGENLVREHQMPEWMPSAAMKAGIDLLTCWRLWRSLCNSLEELDEISVESVLDCLGLFTDVMTRMAPKDIRKILPDQVRAMNTVIDRMLDRINGNEYAEEWHMSPDWDNLWSELADLIWMYMDGRSYAEISSEFLNIELDAIHNRRSQGQAPIPAVFSFIGRALHHLSIYAGALLVVLEESDLLEGNLGAMPLLPLCIRNGCNSRDSLAWFRYGYRNRIAAHEFSQLYPVPPELQDDRDLKVWTSNQKTQWLNQDIDQIESVALRSVWTIMHS